MVVAVKTIIADTKRALGCWRRLSPEVRSYRWALVLLSAATAAGSLAPLAMPVLTQWILDTAYPRRDIALLSMLLLGIVIMQAFDGCMGIISGYLATRIQSGLGYRLSLRCMFSLHGAQHDVRRGIQHVGRFSERVSADSEAVAGTFTFIVPQMASLAFTAVAAVGMMLHLSVWVSLAVIAVVPANYLLIGMLARRQRQIGSDRRENADAIASHVAEDVHGFWASSMYALACRRRAKVKHLLRRRVRLMASNWRANAFWGGLGSAVSALWGIILMGGGWYLVFTEHLRLGQAVALGMYISVLLGPFRRIGSLYQFMVTSTVSMERVLELARTGSITSSKLAPVGIPRSIRLRNVGFSYKQNVKVLRDVNLDLEAGETIVLVGPNGAGKSTLLRLLAGMLGRYDGEIFINETELSRISLSSHMRYLSYTGPEDFFFTDTVLANLGTSLGKSECAAVGQMAEVLGADAWLRALPNGLMTPLPEAVGKASSGQLQMLGILRALLKRPSVLLLDEVTASVHEEAKARLLDGIRQLLPRGCMTIFSTHDPRVVRLPWVSSVIVLENGNPVDVGELRSLDQPGRCLHKWLKAFERPIHVAGGQ
jgi:ABC-type bacteriocin/lantibiotic exporter with double-glycine peptidase domain